MAESPNPATAYDRVPGHPLAGVPQRVFDVTRGAVVQWPGVDPNAYDEVVESVVHALHDAGHLTWFGRLPTRDALIMAVMSAQHWQPDADGRSVAEYLVDTVILPLLAGVVGPSRGGGGEPR